MSSTLVSLGEQLIRNSESIKSTNLYVDPLKEPVLQEGATIDDIAKEIGWPSTIGLNFHRAKRSLLYSIGIETGASLPTVYAATAALGYGDACELCSRGMLKVTKKASSVMVAAETTEGSYQKVHHFLVLNSNQNDHQVTWSLVARGGDFSDFVKQLSPDAVIVDLFLRCVNGKRLSDYIQKFGLHKINKNLSYKDAPTQEETQSLAHHIRETLKTIEISNLRLSCALIDCLRDVGSRASSSLNRSFPGTDWKFNSVNGLKSFIEGKANSKTAAIQVFLQCDQQQAKKIGTQLSLFQIEHRISHVRNSSDRCIIIENPDLAKISQIPVQTPNRGSWVKIACAVGMVGLAFLLRL